MQDKPLSDIQDKSLEEHFRFIYENAQSNDITTVDAEPTTDTLRPKDAPQKFGTDLFFNIEGSIFKIALTAV